MSENLQLSAAEKQTHTVNHFVPFDDLLKKWEAVLGKIPVLRKNIEDAGSTAEEVFRDAVANLEGEGAVLHSEDSNLVHLNPLWLAECVKPLADHRLHTKERRSKLANSWVERAERVTHSGWLEKQSKHLKEWRRRFIAFSSALQNLSY